jgi:hypothetical protein
MLGEATLPGRDEFLELTRHLGVVDVVRISAETLHVNLRCDLDEPDLTYIRRLAGQWWKLDRVVLAIERDTLETPFSFGTHEGA